MNENQIREFLLAALARDRDQEAAAWLNGASPAQWQEIAGLAHLHDVEPLLYQRLETLGIAGRVPQNTGRGLRDAYLQCADQNIRLYHHLAGLLGAFRHEGIAVIPLKGAYLAKQVYDNIAARPMSDVDLLFKKTDLLRADEIMRRNGFSGTVHAFAPEKVREQHDFSYRHTANGLRVEIHWDLISPEYGVTVDIDALWKRSRDAVLAGAPAREMAPEDLVLHLCLHACSHAFETGVRAVCDLAETLRHFREAIEWGVLREQARQWGVERCVCVGLCLAKELLQAPMPENWPDLLKGRDFNPYYLDFARARIWECGELVDAALSDAPVFARFWLTKGIMARAALLRQRVFFPRQEMAMRYPAPVRSLRILLYYPVRWLTLLQRHGKTAWRLFCRDPKLVSYAERQGEVNGFKHWLLSGGKT